MRFSIIAALAASTGALANLNIILTNDECVSFPSLVLSFEPDLSLPYVTIVPRT